MKTLPIVARALAFASVAALLVGCKTAAQSESRPRFRTTTASATRSRCAKASRR